MVQLYDKIDSYPVGPNDYWKLDSGKQHSTSTLLHLLEASNFTCKSKHKGRARLCTLYQRSQRGLLSYDGSSFRELKRFARQRALPLAVSSITSKLTPTILRAQLEQADEDATFDVFSDLPPELREMIFVHYFSSLDSLDSSSARTSHKSQPPITRVSHDVRKESLLPFYDHCRFMLSVRNVASPYRALWLHPLTANFVASTPNFARIRLLKLIFEFHRVSFELDLTNKDNPLHSLSVSLIGYMYGPGVKEKPSRVLAELRPKAMGMAARAGPLRLQMGDIEELGRSLCKILGDHPAKYYS